MSAIITSSLTGACPDHGASVHRYSIGLALQSVSVLRYFLRKRYPFLKLTKKMVGGGHPAHKGWTGGFKSRLGICFDWKTFGCVAKYE